MQRIGGKQDIMQTEIKDERVSILTYNDYCTLAKEYLRSYNQFRSTLENLKNDKTVNTRSIHWYSKSWLPQNPIRDKLVRLLHRLFGKNCLAWLKKILNE